MASPRRSAIITGLSFSMGLAGALFVWKLVLDRVISPYAPDLTWWILGSSAGLMLSIVVTYMRLVYETAETVNLKTVFTACLRDSGAGLYILPLGWPAFVW